MVIQEARLVLFLGPPKSASSSVVKFFSTYASSNDKPEQKVAAFFTNWTSWPSILNHEDGNGLSKMLVVRQDNAEIHEDIKEQVLVAKKRSPNLILGSEAVLG
jgi:hypothetical protein